MNKNVGGNTIMPLDEQDLSILKVLQKDGRISYAELSRIIDLPSSTIHDRVKKLALRGVIKKFTPILDEEIVGVNTGAIIGVETSAKQYKKVADELCRIEDIVEVYGTTAEFDLMIKVKTFTSKELSRVLNEIRRIDGVEDIYVSSILETFKEEHTLPLKGLRTSKII